MIENEEKIMQDFLTAKSCPRCETYSLQLSGECFYTSPLLWHFSCLECNIGGFIGFETLRKDKINWRFNR